MRVCRLTLAEENDEEIRVQLAARGAEGATGTERFRSMDRGEGQHRNRA